MTSKEEAGLSCTLFLAAILKGVRQRFNICMLRCEQPTRTEAIRDVG